MKSNKKIVSSKDSVVTILNSGCHFSGRLYCRGASRIGGRVEGQIVSEGLLIIEESAVVVAEIQAEEVIIQGAVKGRIIAKSRIELSPSSRVDGDLRSPALVVQQGAAFSGRSFMDIEKGIQFDEREFSGKFEHFSEDLPETVPTKDNQTVVNMPEIGTN